MAFTKIDVEKMPLVAESVIGGPTTKAPSQLKIYQALIGDIDAPAPVGKRNISFYHQVVARENKATRWYWITGLTFSTCVAAQIVFCLSISVGVQVGFSNNLISVLAAVNTLVAAAIAALKGLGLPEKKAIERHQLRKVVDQVEYTTRRLQAGLSVDAEKEAEAARRMDDEGEDHAELFRNVGDAAELVPEQRR